MSDYDITERQKTYCTQVEQFIQDWYRPCSILPQHELFEAMLYSLLAGGKRVRSVLAFEFCRMCGKEWQKATPFAAAIEMIHTYSLIHDDLPCMDDDNYRRGMPSNHRVYGEPMALLAGDALLTDAFAVAATSGLKGASMGKAIRLLSECAGSLGMVGGQVLDIKSADRLCTEQEVMNVQTRKTAALISAACGLGVIAGGGTKEQYAAARRFGDALGMAFQIRDDVLDLIGTEEELGKSVGSDNLKNTFVCMYGVKKAERMIKHYTEDAIKALRIFPDRKFMIEYARSLIERRV